MYVCMYIIDIYLYIYIIYFYIYIYIYRIKIEYILGDGGASLLVAKFH